MIFHFLWFLVVTAALDSPSSSKWWIERIIRVLLGKPVEKSLYLLDLNTFFERTELFVDFYPWLMDMPNVFYKQKIFNCRLFLICNQKVKISIGMLKNKYFDVRSFDWKWGCLFDITFITFWSYVKESSFYFFLNLTFSIRFVVLSKSRWSFLTFQKSTTFLSHPLPELRLPEVANNWNNFWLNIVLFVL